MFRTILLTSIFFLFSFSISSQNAIKNSVIVQLDIGISPRHLINKLKRETEIKGKITLHNIAKSPLNLWKIDLEERYAFSNDNLRFIYNINEVKKIQYNHKIVDRIIPDDSKFTSQWSLDNTGQTGGAPDADIDADLAWDITTGGLTPDGDTIVICVIDNGVDIDHEDLVDNLWVNYGEIPNNDIDDDGNGYIDDYYGWNTVLGNDNINGGGHGTSVAGIIGAKGNNSIGVSGINWNIKLMVILKGNDESDVLEAYSYAYTMRKKYNDTNGEKGAFVVSTNSSWGINNANAEDFPIWCSMYDILGSVGILNVVATANSNTNVDIKGDMPSTCSSDFLLAVTNMDKFNKKVNGAGYGVENIDLGAYGKESYTTSTKNGYVSFGGTSAATPHVTGVTGLIYSHSSKLSEMKFSNPEESCLLVKDVILKGTIPNESIKDNTYSGGVLNAFNALKETEKYDYDCASPAKIKIDTLGADLLTLSWSDYNENTKYNIKIKDSSGKLNVIEDVNSPYTFSDLDFCNDYYFSLQSICGDVKSDFGFEKHIKTIGCCTVPDIKEAKLNGSTLHIEWEKVMVSNEYELQYKYWSLPVWETLKTTDSYIDLDYDFDCGQYIFKLKSNCTDTSSLFTKNVLVGDSCIDCSDYEFCQPVINNNLEWIEEFKIGGFDFVSGKDIDGIGNYFNSTSLKLIKGNEYDIELKIGYKDSKFDDYIYIWLDINSDGVFTDDELVIYARTQSDNQIVNKISIPENVVVGNTRMRVLLSAYEIADPCNITNNDFGEYEDYCVYLDTISSCISAKIDTVKVGSDFVDLKWSNKNDLSGFYLELKDTIESDGILFNDFTTDTLYTINNLQKCTDYKLFFVAYCSSYESQALDSIVFKTDCGNAIFESPNGVIKIYPNPVKDLLYFNIQGFDKNGKIDIFNIVGENVFTDIFENSHESSIDLSNRINPGLYFVRISMGDKQFIFKLIKL